MARTPIVGGNWKMNTVRASAVELALAVSRDAADAIEAGVEVAVFPPFVYLDAVGTALRSEKSPVLLGAQDLYFAPSGAFTGEISADQLRDIGVSIVLTGHSERRHIMGESDELVGKKTRAALQSGLRVVLCIGETLQERESGMTDHVNERQIRAGLAGVEAGQLERLVIAYEPVWAIGTGRTATPSDAQAAHSQIRRVLFELYDIHAAGSVRIQYGGSVNAENAAELFAQPDIDGGLIGGASLKPESFVAIADAAAKRA